MLATHKASLEARLGLSQPIPCSHPVIRWLVEHVAFILNRCQMDKHGRTPYGHLHGKDVKDHLCEFGETILWFVPKKTRAKLDHKWRYGTFLGRAMHTDANWVGLRDGSVVTARAIVRVVPRNRWSIDRINAIAGVPGAPRAPFDAVEAEPEPHSFVSG